MVESYDTARESQRPRTTGTRQGLPIHRYRAEQVSFGVDRPAEPRHRVSREGVAPERLGKGQGVGGVTSDGSDIEQPERTLGEFQQQLGSPGRLCRIDELERSLEVGPGRSPETDVRERAPAPEVQI